MRATARTPIRQTEAVVGALERELVMTVGSGRGRTLTKDQKKKTKVRDYTAAEKAAATPP